MATSDYRLSAHRYRELKHFCLQYPEMVARARELSYRVIAKNESDLVGDVATKFTNLMKGIRLIETTATLTSTKYSTYIFDSVTKDASFSTLKAPIEKGEFDDLRAKFFWLLSERKGY